MRLGVSAADIDQTFSAAWASLYINNFLDTDNRMQAGLRAGRAEIPHESRGPERLVRAQRPPAAWCRSRHSVRGPGSMDLPSWTRFNGIPATEIQGAAASGKSTGQAMNAMEAIAAKLPPGIGYEWTGLSLPGARSPVRRRRSCYGISILFVFLVPGRAV
ncbi:efflux RND transporter permease subunit [Cupriavidus basilensis]